MTKLRANYNGETIKDGEVMVPFTYCDAEACNYTNLECIKTKQFGEKKFKVVYKAVPEEWAKDAKSATNLEQNEELGHYAVPNSVSMDQTREEYELELKSVPSVEDVLAAKDELNEAVHVFADRMQELIRKSPKLGYAVMLLYTGVKGEEFYQKMLLTRDPANRIRKQAEGILYDGLLNYDHAAITSYKSKNDDVYRNEALQLLATVIADF